MKWERQNGDAIAHADTGTYEIEQASADRWWAYADEKPVGIYASFREAMKRCEAVDNERQAASVGDAGYD